jgi:hypothetical protein
MKSTTMDLTKGTQLEWEHWLVICNTWSLTFLGEVVSFHVQGFLKRRRGLVRVG